MHRDGRRAECLRTTESCRESSAAPRAATGVITAANSSQISDGAAALLCGTENVIAKLIGHHSVSMDFVDHFRGDETDFDYGWEERWIRDEGYSKIVPPAIKADKTMRCADNSLVYVTFFEGDKQAVVRTEKGGTPTTLTAATAGEPLTAEGGWSMTGDTANVKIEVPGKGWLTTAAPWERFPRRLFWLLAALGKMPRVKPSTKGEGHERRYFYGSVWAVTIGCTRATPSITASRTTSSILSPFSRATASVRCVAGSAAGVSARSVCTSTCSWAACATRASNSRPCPLNTRTVSPTRARNTRTRCPASSAYRSPRASATDV